MDNIDADVEKAANEMGRRMARTLNKLATVYFYLERRFVRENFPSWIYFGYY